MTDKKAEDTPAGEVPKTPPPPSPVGTVGDAFDGTTSKTVSLADALKAVKK